MSRYSLTISLAAALVAACAAGAPASSPTLVPTTPPTSGPIAHPTAAPTASPTAAPTPSPTSAPTVASTPTPTAPPTSRPGAWPEGIVARPLLTGDAGSELGYLEYLPPGYDDGSPLPLLVFLHGAGESGDGSEEHLRNVLKLGIPAMIADGGWPAEHPFVVLMPQYPEAEAETDCELGDELESFLDFAIDSYAVDEARIYLTGISCGAIGIWDYLAQTEVNRVAAAVPIAGHPVWAMEKAGCDVARTPIWVFHGALDDVVPVHYVEDSIEELRSCTDPPPSEIQLTIYPDADHFESDAWTRTYDLSAGHDVFAWLLDHRLGD